MRGSITLATYNLGELSPADARWAHPQRTMATQAPRILLVDDEQSVQTLLAYPLRKEGYEVVAALDGQEALDRLREGDLRPRRAGPDAPARRRLRGLPPGARPQLGPDHHAHRQGRGDRQGARPRARRRRLHHQAVLGARVPQPGEGGAAPGRAGAARRRRSRSRSRTATCGSTSRSAPWTLAGEPVRLTYVEFEILAALARNPGRVYNRMVLLERVWGDASYRDPRTVDVHIRHLREKLEREPKRPELIHTVRGRRATASASDEAAVALGIAAQQARARLLRDHRGGARDHPLLRRARSSSRTSRAASSTTWQRVAARLGVAARGADGQPRRDRPASSTRGCARWPTRPTPGVTLLGVQRSRGPSGRVGEQDLRFYVITDSREEREVPQNARLAARAVRSPQAGARGRDR